MNSIGIIFGVIVIAFLIWQVCLLVRDVKARKDKKLNKVAETSAAKQQTGVGSTQLEDHKKEN